MRPRGPDAAALLEQAAAAGIHLWAEGNRLRFRAQAGELPGSLKRDLREHRAEVIAELRRRAAEKFTDGPTAANQHGLWFLHRLSPENSAYNVAFAARIHGALDVNHFREAVQILVDRHEALRTVYPPDTGEPVRRVLECQAVEVEVTNATNWPEERLRQALQTAYQQPFDLSSGPLIRVSLFSEAPDRTVLLLVAHHIAVDGTSMFVLIEELANVYGALLNSAPVPARESAEFAEFVEWQHRALDQMDRARKYWKNVLEPPSSPLDLPKLQPSRRIPRHEGRTHWETVNASVTAELRSFARAEGVTDYVLLLGLWLGFLHRLTKSSDITVGTPVQGRPSARFERTVGDFVNTLPLRVREIDALSVRGMLTVVRTTVLEALAHQDLPLPFMRQPAGGRDASGPPFETLFVLQDFTRFAAVERLMLQNDASPVQVGALTLSRVLIDQQEGQFELALDLWPRGDELLCAWRYDDELFDPEWIASWSRSFATFAASAARQPACLTSELPLIDRITSARLAEWNTTERAYRTDVTLVDLLVEQAARTPDAVAVSAPDGTYTYAQLLRRAQAIAVELRRLGVAEGDRVAIVLPRGRDLPAALLGVLGSGAAYVPLDPHHPVSRLEHALTDSGASAVVTAAGMPRSELPMLDVDACGDAMDTFRRTSPSATAYVIYTSGSTGRPKGVAVSHSALVNFLFSMAEEPGISPSDALLAVTTVSFDIAALELFLPLIRGARIVIAHEDEVFDGARLARKLEAEGITVLQATPVTWKLLLEASWAGKADLRALCGGEALPEALAEALLPRVGELWNLYGPTETTVWSTIERIRPGDPITVGRPIANTTLYLLDEHMQPVPIGVPGELWIGGTGVARGYLNRPELTAERFMESPFRAGERIYRTGDLVRWLSDGRLQHLGRLDFQVKVRGFRIELGEIEARLREHPAVKDVVVVARDERLVAYVVTDQSVLPVDELRSWLSEALPDYMVPAIFMALDALPLTPNGKVDRKALPEARPASRSKRTGTRPATATETQLAAIWSDLLGVDAPTLEDSFFEVGGNSLTAARMIHAIRDRLGAELPVRAVFDAPRLGELAAHVDACKGSDGAGELLEVIEF